MSERDGTAVRVLPVEIAGAAYALPLAAVREVLPYASPVAVPGMPPSIVGVVSVRGSAIPMIDLGEKLGRGRSTPTARARIVVVEPVVGGARLRIGLLVHAAGEPLEIPRARIEAPPAAGRRVDFVTGIGRPDGAYLRLLEVDRVVSASESDLAAQDELLRAAELAEREAARAAGARA